MSDTPQRTFTGGPFFTMDPAAPDAEALAVRDGTITAAGAARDVLALRGPGTDVVDLQGRAPLPGFIEAHGPPTIMGLAVAPSAVDVRPFTVPTGWEVYDEIRAAVASAPGRPVGAYGIDLLLQRDLASPTRDLLDGISPYAPLVVVSNSGHAAYGNTPALRAAGITAATSDPPGGRFVRDESGEPSGEAHESAAVIALMNTVAGDRLDEHRVRTAPRWSFAQHARVGITTVTEMAAEPRLLPDLRAAAEQPDAEVRVRAYVMGTPEPAADPGRRFTGYAPRTRDVRCLRYEAAGRRHALAGQHRHQLSLPGGRRHRAHQPRSLRPRRNELQHRRTRLPGRRLHCPELSRGPPCAWGRHL